jgi:phosphoglycerol transferase MdoB-like AlkP superfamily enzyme
VKAYKEQLRVLALRLLVVVLTYQLCRAAFLIANFAYFKEAAATDILWAFIAGLRFDLSAIAFTNGLIILLHVIPFRRFFDRGFQKLAGFLFYLLNLPAILLNCIDLEYFKYQGKRTTADLFSLFTMGSDMQNTLPAMARDFWYVIVVFVAVVFLMVRMYKAIRPVKMTQVRYSYKNYVAAVAIVALTIVAARGGIQYKPLGILSAAQHVPQRLVPLALNTGFTVIRTIGKSTLDEKSYFTPQEAAAIFNPIKNYTSADGFRQHNVVVIIMESFSSEYIGYFNNNKGFTPVLDSLIRNALVFTSSFANAKKSIDGMPAITAAIPTLMPFSYITSPYNGNKAESLAALLRKKGYTSGFYHGGNNGTMGFDNFARMTGFESYYGRNEYPGDGYDGHWGIYDEPYFRYFAEECKRAKQPFVNVLFSLSSHHPYSIPDNLKGKFPKGALPIHESLGYADYALGKFLDDARDQPWFKNTLFVITADHTGPNHDKMYNSTSGMFRVPVVYFMGDGSLKGVSGRVTQQCDIIPSVLDYLNYDLPFLSFGNSVFDKASNGRAINFTGNVYQAFNDSLMIQFDGESLTGVYRFNSDPLLETDLTGMYQKEQRDLENYAKALIQQFNHAMIRNEMTYHIEP